MSGIICVKTEVKNKKLKEFLRIAKTNYNLVPYMKYNFDSDHYTEVIFKIELLGYAEPCMLFRETRNMVKDIWYNCVGDDMVKVGKDYKKSWWISCKNELRE